MRTECRGENLSPHSGLSSTIKRTLVAWAALAGLLAAPVAETVHEFQHLSQAQSGAKSKQTGGVKPACETCAAYAAMGHALWTPPAFQAQRQSAPARFVLSAPGISAERAHAYQERAPPTSSPSA